MMASAAASVPGKTILFGEHAAVYGHPAIVAALDHRMRVAVKANAHGRGGIGLELPSLGMARRFERDEIATIVAKRSAERPGDLALAAVALSAGAWQGDLDVRVDSAIPSGAGFGSSAALAVGIAASCRRACDLPATPGAIAAIALTIERYQHGNPSGIDVHAVLRGGAWWCRRDETGVTQEEIRLSPEALAAFRLFDTGTRAESTGEMIERVLKLRGRTPGVVEAAFTEMDRATHDGRAALESGDVAALVATVRRAHAALQAVDVVHPDVSRAVAAIEVAGGAAKISGAGGCVGKGSGLLLVVHEDPEWRRRFAVPPGWTPHPVALGAPGLREEVAA
jgi:mevalonate kinase